jgi:phosphatidylglycerol lysyltransferase
MEPAEIERIRGLVARFGRNATVPLIPYATDRVWWAAGDAFVAFTVQGRVAVVLGDPVCDEADLDRTVKGFVEFAKSNYLGCVFFQVGSEPYARMGLRLVPLGSEAVIDLAAFGLCGARRAPLRHALSRARRSGLRLVTLPAVEAILQFGEELAAVSDAWLRARGEREMRFSLGGLSTLRDPSFLVTLAVDPSRRVEGFVSWLPVISRRSLTLDLMRRRPQATPGVMTALIAQAASDAVRSGYLLLNLGMAPFHLPDGSGSRWLRLLYRRLGRFHRSLSLQRFKDRFSPNWELRYLATDRGIPRAATAVLRAHLGARNIREQLALLWPWVGR